MECWVRVKLTERKCYDKHAYLRWIGAMGFAVFSVYKCAGKRKFVCLFAMRLLLAIALVPKN